MNIPKLFNKGKNVAKLLNPKSSDKELFDALRHASKEEQSYANTSEKNGTTTSWYVDPSSRYIEQYILLKYQRRTFWLNCALVFLTLVTASVGISSFIQGVEMYKAANRPYINLDSISYDGNTTINFKLLNPGKSVAKDVFFVFAKFEDSPDLGQKAFEYRAVPGHFLTLEVRAPETGQSGIMLVPTTMGDIGPGISRSIELNLENKEDILWLREDGNLINLVIGYKDSTGDEEKHYYLMKYEKNSRTLIVLAESEFENFPIGSAYAGNYYYDLKKEQ
ncbi:MAG: hypothetical protein G01um101417_216 [Parcubacteria group bacterium Gr01-1014_17]|nr:MAG: hypothetical protein G01um101417_216 [Parcubacteria group bacterium Gr01-1014_17]